MAVLDQKINVGSVFSNAAEIKRVEYDFSVDGGLVADYDVLVADSACIVEFKFASVDVALTSGGSLVMDLGKEAGGVEFFSDKAVAALTIDSLHSGDNFSAKQVELAAGEKIVMGIEGAAATAGKMAMVFAVYKK